MRKEKDEEQSRGQVVQSQPLDLLDLSGSMIRFWVRVPQQNHLVDLQIRCASNKLLERIFVAAYEMKRGSLCK